MCVHKNKYIYSITIGKKEAMNVKKGEEGVYGRVWQKGHEMRNGLITLQFQVFKKYILKKFSVSESPQAITDIYFPFYHRHQWVFIDRVRFQLSLSKCPDICPHL